MCCFGKRGLGGCRLWHGVVPPGVTRHACLGEIESWTGILGLIDSLGKAVDVKYSV